MLKRIIIVQFFIFVIGQLFICSTALGSLINMTGAEQQVGGEIGYFIGAVDIPLESHFDPTAPQGLSNANLSVSFSNSGVSLSESLASVFSGDQVTASGSAFASAVWGSQPIDATDVHGGGGSIFNLYFTRESSPAYFFVDGQIAVDIESYPTLHPDEVYVYIKLSSDDGGGMTTIWEELTNGVGGDNSWPASYGLWLETGVIYLLEAYAEAGTVASSTYPGFKSRMASFSLTTIVTEGEPASIDIVQDTISNKTKTITCNIWPPSGYDVTEIDPSSILLSDGIVDIPPYRVSVRKKQQMLVVKFPTSGLSLDPTPELVLTVTGELTDGTPFEDSDIVEVVRKGKPN